MQIKFFTIPIMGGEKLQEELNTFLRSRKVLQVEQHIINNGQESFWCLAVRYLTGTANHSGSSNAAKKKIDYKEVLDATSFQRFSDMRIIRKKIAVEQAIPAFAIFTDAELAALAKLEGELTLKKLQSVKGVGEKKATKYGHYFIKNEKDGASH